MFALPAQFAWASAAGYCAHESDPVSFHVGHHAHEHRASLSGTDPAVDPADAETPSEPVKNPPAQGHADCSYCHAVVAQLAAPPPSALGPPPRDVLVASRTVLPGSGIGDDIDRPKWTPAG